MSRVDFYYFPLKGLGEPTRLLLAYGEVKFEDNRLAKDTWPDLKPSTPFGQLPMLVMDGKKYSQSLAIARFLGQKFGLAGKDVDEAYKIDEIVDFLFDIRNKAYNVYFEEDEAVKAKKHEALAKDFYPTALAKLDQIIKKNNGHMALGRLTWADFVLAGLYEYLRVILQMPDMDEKFPRFRKIYDTVYSIPKVKAFSDTAPKSEYGF